MKKYTYEELVIAWHKHLIENVIHDSYIVEFTKAKFPYTLHLKNIKKSEIEISTRWGFITLEFKSFSMKEKFSDFLKLEFGKDKYNCRIYFDSSKRTISFYKLSEMTFNNLNEELNYYINILNNLLERIDDFNRSII